MMQLVFSELIYKLTLNFAHYLKLNMICAVHNLVLHSYANIMKQSLKRTEEKQFPVSC